jgi:hypothetical protein
MYKLCCTEPELPNNGLYHSLGVCCIPEKENVETEEQLLAKNIF